MVKNMPARARDARDVGSVLRLGRSPGEGNGNLLQYSFLENSMDRGAWRAKVHGVLKSWTQLRDWVQCSLTISSSATLFSSCLQSFPESGSFLMSWLFTPGGQSAGAPASVLPMNIKGSFLPGLTGWISLQSKGLSRVFSNTTVQKHSFFGTQPSLWPYSHIHTDTGKTTVWTIRTFVSMKPTEHLLRYKVHIHTTTM